MNVVKAVCKCNSMSETDLVVAVKSERFGFIDQWGFWVWAGVLILTLLTSGLWLCGIVGYHFNDLFRPKYYCNQCNDIIYPKQFRL